MTDKKEQLEKIIKQLYVLTKEQEKKEMDNYLMRNIIDCHNSKRNILGRLYNV